MRSFGIHFPCIKKINTVDTQTPINSKQAVEQLGKLFPDVFKSGIGTFNKCTKKLTVSEGAHPVWRRARPVPHVLRPAVSSELARLQNEGVISPVDWSEWGTPVVPVIKKNGQVRLCGDFKTTINPVLVDDKYPIPRIEDVFTALQGGLIFAKIDLSNAYLQFVLDEASKKLCTIVTHQGMFCFNRLPFGIKCAPNKFQRIMEKLFNIPFVACYLDDLTVCDVDYKKLWKRVLLVFKILSDSGLRVAPDKCSFFKKSITYLGYVIDAQGLHTDQLKVDAVCKTPIPKNTRQLKAFLGLVNYYGKFLRNLSGTLSPLYNLLKKGNKFVWTKPCDNSFDAVKKALSECGVLAHYNAQAACTATCDACTATCDASPHGVAGVLSQRAPDGTERPVLHASRTLNAAEKNYAQICREGLAVIFAVTKFHDYIYGREFTLVTDCKPLVAIFN
jgi:hypothetical protein